MCDDHCLLVSGFDSQSECSYSVKARASGLLAVLGLDMAPSILLSSYDPDTGLVLLTGKGITHIFLYKLLPECDSFMSMTQPAQGLGPPAQDRV